MTSSNVVPFPVPGSDDDSAPVVAPPSVPQPGALRGWLERQAPLPDRHRAVQSARWWTAHGSKGLLRLLVRLPLLALFELRPIFRGLGRVLTAWSKWCAVADLRSLVAAGEGNTKVAAGLKVEAARSGRRRMSLAAAVTVVGASVGAYYVYPTALAVAGFGLVGILDLIGRRGTEKPPPLPGATKTVLREGVPLHQISAAIVDTALREGLELGIARPMRYDHKRGEYRLAVSCLDLIEPKHLRAIERGIGADDHTIRSLATGTATTRELVIRDGDPLAEFVEAPPIPTGGYSIGQPLPLGVSMTETPFALVFAGVHFRVVGASGSGKTKWFLRSCIRAVSACRDAVILGIDLTNGPELALWRGVIQKKGFTPEDAEAVLDAMLAEIDRRGKILAAFAEDDDPENDVDEWHTGLGPAWICFADEFSLTVVYDGKSGKSDLLGKCEVIVRTGRKHWVSLVMLTQRTGNSDFGSQVMSSQCATTVMLACDPRDTITVMGVEQRDAGYAPHQLAPGVEGDPRDAGKCYISSPAHRTPDIYRAYAPGTTARVKQDARQRIADGLPPMYPGSHPDLVDEVEGAVVPPILAAVDQVFSAKRDPEWMATADLLPLVRDALGEPDLTEAALSAGIPVDKDVPGSRRRRPKEKNPVRGYLLASIREAMDQL